MSVAFLANAPIPPNTQTTFQAKLQVQDLDAIETSLSDGYSPTSEDFRLLFKVENSLRQNRILGAFFKHGYKVTREDFIAAVDYVANFEHEHPQKYAGSQSRTYLLISQLLNDSITVKDDNDWKDKWKHFQGGGFHSQLSHEDFKYVISKRMDSDVVKLVGENLTPKPTRGDLHLALSLKVDHRTIQNIIQVGEIWPSSVDFQKALNEKCSHAILLVLINCGVHSELQVPTSSEQSFSYFFHQIPISEHHKYERPVMRYDKAGYRPTKEDLELAKQMHYGEDVLDLIQNHMC